MSKIKELAKDLCDKSTCHHKCSDTDKCIVEEEAELLINGNKTIPKIRPNPNWRENKNRCCCFCGETRSVKYLVDLPNIYGERVLTVDACNRCALLLINENKSNNSDFKSNNELFKQALVEGVNRRFDKNLMKNDLFESIVWKELDDGATALDIDRTTENLYSIGYRKQSEGEWISVECKPHLSYKCSKCGDGVPYGFIIDANYCPNCGAKMKGGAK